MKTLLVLAAFAATTQASPSRRPCDLLWVGRTINPDFLDQCIQSAGSDFTVSPPAPTDETLAKMCRSYGCWMLESDIDRLQTRSRCDLSANTNIASSTFADVGSRANLGHLGETFRDFTSTCKSLSQPRCTDTVDTAVETLLTIDEAVIEDSCAQDAGFSFAYSTDLPSDDVKLNVCRSASCRYIVKKIREQGVPACFTLWGNGVLDQIMQSFDADCDALLEAFVAPPNPGNNVP